MPMRWRDLGRRILDKKRSGQFYEDGGYIQQSHNYHRVALQDDLWRAPSRDRWATIPSDVWLRALDRSLDFLVAHQNPSDGRLPNYGSNDGALPSLLSTCDFADMRPTLQAVSVLVRGNVCTRPGHVGRRDRVVPGHPRAGRAAPGRPSDVPFRFTCRRPTSLRGTGGGSFAAFRCGTLRIGSRRSTLLHLDVWWRGLNVARRSGQLSVQRRARLARALHATASHNTVVLAPARSEASPPVQSVLWTERHRPA